MWQLQEALYFLSVCESVHTCISDFVNMEVLDRLSPFSIDALWERDKQSYFGVRRSKFK